MLTLPSTDNYHRSYFRPSVVIVYAPDVCSTRCFVFAAVTARRVGCFGSVVRLCHRVLFSRSDCGFRIRRQLGVLINRSLLCCRLFSPSCALYSSAVLCFIVCCPRVSIAPLLLFVRFFVCV